MIYDIQSTPRPARGLGLLLLLIPTLAHRQNLARGHKIAKPYHRKIRNKHIKVKEGGTQQYTGPKVHQLILGHV